MSLLAAAILLVSVAQCFCNTRTCTIDERCLEVDAAVCDNRKCLLVEKTDLDKTVNYGVKSFTFNIVRTSLSGFCPISINLQQPEGCDGNSTINTIMTLYSGRSCNETRTVLYQVVSDPDPKETGHIRIMKGEIDGYKYEECFMYLDPGKAVVFRRCFTIPGLPAGKACASIIAKQVATENCASPELDVFVRNLNIDLPQMSVDCL